MSHGPQLWWMSSSKLTNRAVWTRFHPIAYAVQDVLKSGRLGKVHRMFADFSMNFEPDSELFPCLASSSILLPHPASRWRSTV